ncbi:MAG: SufD family Fe-S cluster assembly protein [Candidatus Thermoplasmatota archaeon]|nr:SufD family Fe-S cluster assembly protein [Candidatus Thermoplasmatota archaeon]
MESYPETLKTRLHDEAYEYRRDAFLAFLKSPVRDYKESPTVKDYVEITDKELQEMLYGEMKEIKESPEFSETANIRVFNDEIEVSSELQKQGVIVTSMVDALKTQPELVKKYVYPKLGKERIEFLINSAWRNGLFIFIPEGAKASIRAHTISNASASFASKTVIVYGKESRIRYTDTYSTAGQGTGIQGKNIYFFGGESSRFDYLYLQDKNDGVRDITFVKQHLDRYAEFQFFHINHGSSKVLFVDESQQVGLGSSFRVYGINFSNEDQKMDIRDSSCQDGEESNADIQVRGVVTGRSSTIHRGNIDLEERAIKATGFYDSKILLLSRDGFANSKPGLEIKNANTRSKHGSAISNVDEEQIFYLRSRGIEDQVARGMVTAGFVGSMIEKANDEEFTRKVYQYAESLGANAFLATN